MSVRRYLNWIIIFCRLPWQEQALLPVIFILTALVRAAILLLPFAWLARFLGKGMAESCPDLPPDKLPAVRRLGRAIARVSAHTPWESKCLVQAIVGKILLRRLGLPNTLYLGVGRDEKNAMIAHAWLRCGDVYVSGGAGREQFTVVGKFADL